MELGTKEFSNNGGDHYCVVFEGLLFTDSGGGVELRLWRQTAWI